MQRWRMIGVVAVLSALGLALLGAAPGDEAAEAGDEGWITLFDGETLDGWTVTGNGHGTGGLWQVADGAITGTQDRPGNGGILLSDETYDNFEIEVEVKPDWGIDSGLFLRSKPDGACYQATIDFRPDGQVATLYGEGVGGWLQPNEAWREHWREDDWNTIRARVVGNPPRIQLWLNGEPTVDFTDTEQRLPSPGHIALQVHGGGDWGGKQVRFRNVRIRPLDAAGEPVAER